MASKDGPRSAYDCPPKNERWGTIVETNRGLGKQKCAKDDVDAVVDRLSATKDDKPPESNRTGALKESGIMNSYAWRGY